MKGFFKRLGEVWNIAGVTIILLVLIEICFRIYFLFYTSEDSRIHADCYQNASWVEDYYSEFSQCNASRWEPYIYWVRKPYSGKYIQVDENGIRNTVSRSNPLSNNEKITRIFFFGGSTMWGSGVRDAYTIPSLTGSELSKKEINPIITNFGETGFVSSQEVTRLILELKSGNVPDIAVFYDGVNDVYGSFQMGKAGLPQNEYNREKEFNTLKEKKKSFWVFIQSLSTLATVKFAILKFGKDKDIIPSSKLPVDTNLADQTVHQYNENIRLVNALAKQYDFQAVFYWQPTIFNKSYLSDYETAEKEKVEGLTSFNAAVNSRLYMDDLEHENIRFYNLSNIFREQREAVYIDWCHVSEEGNMIIAKRMASDLLPVIDTANAINLQFDE